MVIINLYCPPPGNIANAIAFMNDVFNHFIDTRQRLDLLLVGDLNINQLEDSPVKRLLADFCDDFDLISNLSIPTRVTHNSST